ncbi:MAG: nuclear transport factor 2 family protein [Parvularculaceae bacterium]|nr:nuclear transport factor 2 family protein [Parvularculaceae bacterium]
MQIKSIFTALFALSLLTACDTAETSMTKPDVQQSTPDEAAVATVVEAVANLADRREFDALSRLFAEEFVLDYSSLNGQAATSTTPLALMGEWAAVLPGFDRTRHDLSNIRVQIESAEATATADVVALHWFGASFWQVSGRYDFSLRKRASDWQITAMTYTLEDETGSREIFGPVLEAAGTKAVPGHTLVVAERNKASVRRFFGLLESGNIDGMVELFAEDAMQNNPYTGGVFPSGARGKEALLAYWSPVPDRFDSMRFPIEQLMALEDPNIVFVRYRGELVLPDGAGVYQNQYFSTFRFNADGQITEYVEIFDPVVAARSFGLLEELR